MSGVLTAQLLRLQHAPSPNPKMGFFVLGVPLAATFIVLGMLVLMIGAWRFWRQQRAMIRGKVLAGGWEICGIMVLAFLVSERDADLLLVRGLIARWGAVVCGDVGAGGVDRRREELWVRQTESDVDAGIW